MNAYPRRVVFSATAICLAVSLSACGKAGGGDGAEDGAGGDGKSIGLLLPENKTTRYETFDRPLIEKKIKSLCSDCEVRYNNATQDTETQKKQFDALITQGVKVIILDAVNAEATKSWVDRAARKGVKVVAYDRLAEGDISAYVSYDNEEIGRLQGQGLVRALGEKAGDSRIVMINGSPTDPNAALYKKGAHSVLDKKTGEIVYEQDIPDWSPDEANKKMGAAITKVGKDGFDGVYAANDGMAGGVATAMKKSGVQDVPLGGQDAELAGLQRIVKGDQDFTVYKAIKPEAETAAAIAVKLLKGGDIGKLAPERTDSKSARDIPAKLYDAEIVTRDNIKDTVVKDKVYTPRQICDGKQLAKACADAGLL
ncbi:substrate-binding domain-containing protein [Streptomyces sp. HNM0574]|uniref:substrate-binding domain-containing protein n=1 Tax=Streptomyces sp. HNM0574 TaxID=2714954 RepID=UPI00146A0E25|nr:substrate-binding domain-containing protein [Streptomyces sp. HNM0574]NLU65813.1 sugar ABC transporter substrate-binding protein [Streptomyces sp. HNM0574]